MYGKKLFVKEGVIFCSNIYLSKVCLKEPIQEFHSSFLPICLFLSLLVDMLKNSVIKDSRACRLSPSPA